MKKNNKQGFTLIEFVLIFALVGLSLSILVIIVSSLGLKDADLQKLRDTKRLSDMNQIRTGLDLFLSQAGGYPDASFWISGGTISCGSSHLIQVPHDPMQPESLYVYKGKGTSSTSKTCGNKIWSDYSIQFQMEATILGPAGVHCLRPTQGITQGVCP